MTRKKRLFIAIAIVPVLVIAGALLYINFADLSGWRDTVARIASDAIGRELRINGEFQPEIGFTTRVVATDVTLANAEWSSDPYMVAVDRLAGEIDLLSILFGPITIGDAEIDGARVLFETGADGRFNWALGDGEPSEGGGGEFEMVIGHAALDAIHLIYRSGSGQDFVAELSKLEFTDDGTGMLDLGLAGSLDGDPIELSGRLGTFLGLINANRVEHDLRGRLADAEFSLRGSIEDLSSLSGVDGDVSVSGPDPGQITKPFGLDPVVEGPFSVAASVKPSATGSDFNLDASLGGMTGKAVGTVDSIVNPGALDVSVDASGPDTTAIGSIAGIDDLPAKPFAVSGRVQWAGFPLSCDNVEVRVGDNTLSAHGVLGKPPLMMGTDFHFNGGGPDISAVAALAGLEVPKDRYAVDGHLVRLEHGVGVEKVSLEIGGITVEANGTVGDPPGYEGTALSFHGTGANLARLGHFVRFDLPAQPFSINGALAQGDGAIELEGVSARLGATTLQVSGQLSTADGLTGTDLRLKAEGSDASQLANLAGFERIPAEDFKVAGRFQVVATGYRLHDVVASLGTMNVKADGLIAGSPKIVGSDLQIHVDDSDLGHPASIAGITGLPADSLSVDGRLRVEAAGYRLDGLKAFVGDMELEANGLVGEAADLEGTRLHIDARGPRLSSLDQYLDTKMPPAPFSVSGTVRITGGAYAVDDVVAEIDGNTAIVNGTVQPVEKLLGTELDLEFSGPDLEGLRQLAAGFVDLPVLPSEPFTLEAGLQFDEQGYRINGLRATLAEAEAEVDGQVGFAPDFFGTDLTIESDGPNASLVTALTGVTIPVAPFRVRGRVQRTAEAFHFDRLSVQLGKYAADAHGSVGEPPHFIGTDLELRASGPSLELIGELAGRKELPDQPFRVAGRFEGTSERFTTDGLEIFVGESDLRGTLEVDIRAKPAITVEVVSSRLDLSPYLKPLDEVVDDAPEEQANPRPETGEKAISNRPIDFSPLQKVDGEVNITIGTLQFPIKVFRDVKLSAKLADGRLEIEQISATGRDQGTLAGSLVLEPVADEYRLDTDVVFRQIRLDIAGSKVARMEQPPIDIDIDFNGRGATPHQLASSSNGWLQIVIGEGLMDSRVLDMVTADILLTLLKAFNPFAKEEAVSELQCGVFLLSLEDGVATLEPMAVQSNKMTLLGHGKVNLETENLNFEWVTKPRKGIGVSPSMITNPYIRLGGTLSAPAVQLKEAEAVVQTGAAVATLGLSLVAKGMYDRVTAEKKVCKKALEEIGRRADGSTKEPTKK